MRVIALCLILLFTRVCYSQLIIAFPTGDNTPQYSDVNGQLEGFLPTLVNHFSEQTGYNFIFSALPIRRYVELFQQGKIDFILPSNPAWSDNKYGNVLFSDVIMISRSGFVRRNESKGLPVKAVATVQGYTLPALEDKHKDEKYFESFTVSTYASLEMLKRKRVDAVYAHLDFVKTWVQKNNYESNFYFEPNLKYDNYAYHLSTIKHPDILKEFNHWLSEHRSTVNSLMKKYNVGSESLID